MNIFARAIGVGTYIAILLIVIGFMQHQDRKNAKKMLFVYLIVLVMMGYLYKPDQTADLYRYIKNMNYYALFPFERLFKFAIKSTHPGSIFYLYILGQFGNDSILPALSAFIDLTLIFSIIKSEADRNNSNGVVISEAIFLLMSTGVLMGMISGIRNTMAYCIIIWCFYRECILKKKISYHIPLYLIAASIHSMGQVVFIYRLIMLVHDRRNNKENVASKMVGITLIVLILLYGQKYLEGIITKGNNYINAEEGDSAAYFYIWNFILAILKTVTSYYLIYEFNKIRSSWSEQEKKNNRDLMNYVEFMKPICFAIPVFMILQYSFFTRTTALLHLLNVPLYLIIVSKAKDYETRRRIKLRVILISSIVLILACLRGNICSLKFFY